MSLEEQLTSWTGPSSNTEQEKQDRTERMIRRAIDAHPAFDGVGLNVFAKGSYANNTNVRADSDVDIAVECTEAIYWEESQPGVHRPSGPYTGIWTPAKLRTELVAALQGAFGSQVDTSGSTAIQIHSGSARVDADVVPCFSYRYHWSASDHRPGTKIFKKDGSSIVNYPSQQLEKGRVKNNRTNYAYKKGVRLLKRIENAMADAKTFRELPSFFMECLSYNCADQVFAQPTWTATLREMLIEIWNATQSDQEPATGRWLEVSECVCLFHPNKKWTRKDGREFAQAAWNYFGFK